MSDTSIWAVIPAAGVGRRMGADIPKQYLPLAGRSVLEQTIRRLNQLPRVSGIYVATSGADEHWPEVAAGLSDIPHLQRVEGGSERCHSVLNALDALLELAAESDWVMVHDAARPCVRLEDLNRLVDDLQDDEVGGLLAHPVRDTMKRDDGTGRIERTEDRQGLWHALTPQMFRLGALRSALANALAAGEMVTDEASAMEFAGYFPKLVEGRVDNIKITHPEDLALAEFFLTRQSETPAGESECA
ncbi:MAG: 2-C-methyl-D-erythritol 4-phosphate cytidylyltransferase [Gammaproteobacteria bacterium]